jgi:hypothetical protein
VFTMSPVYTTWLHRLAAELPLNGRAHNLGCG